MIVVGGVHGNEPAGVGALQQILPILQDRVSDLHGRFVALTGNLQALSAGRRFMDVDFNRVWAESGPTSAGEATLAEGVEARERVELEAAIDEVTAGVTGPVYFIDLHTTSGLGGIFTTVADTLPNRGFALEIPVPLVLGLEELVEGTLMAAMVERGFVSMVFESGQHEEPEAVARAIAGLWIAISAAGLLPEGRVPELSGARKRLSLATRHLPRVLEMRYRHAVEPGDGFVMDDGFDNFQIVREGDGLAQDESGRIASPESGRILMPLYQEQGNDGFFVVREFSPFWLSVSNLLRVLRFGRIVHLMPGVRASEEVPHALEVNRHVARWYALQLLHLLGYRKVWDRGDKLFVVRREHDA